MMASVSHAGFKIKGLPDGTLYRARVERIDRAQFRAGDQVVEFWETPQHVDRDTAIGQAIYLIDCGKIKL